MTFSKANQHNTPTEKGRKYLKKYSSHLKTLHALDFKKDVSGKVPWKVAFTDFSQRPTPFSVLNIARIANPATPREGGGVTGVLQEIPRVQRDT